MHGSGLELTSFMKLSITNHLNEKGDALLGNTESSGQSGTTDSNGRERVTGYLLYKSTGFTVYTHFSLEYWSHKKLFLAPVTCLVQIRPRKKVAGGGRVI